MKQVPDDALIRKNQCQEIKKSPYCSSQRLQCDGLTTIPLNLNLNQMSFKSLFSFFLKSLKTNKLTNLKFQQYRSPFKVSACEFNPITPYFKAERTK